MATDVYALGCMLYEMLAGRRAAAGSILATLQAAHCRGELRPLSGDVAAGVSDVLAEKAHPFGAQPFGINDPFGCLPGKRKAGDG